MKGPRMRCPLRLPLQQLLVFSSSILICSGIKYGIRLAAPYSHPRIPDLSFHHAQVVVPGHLRDGCDDVSAATLHRDSVQKD